uniref:FBA_2 domain-containing protein n=1 Tax=Caenorhabditis tropicalis TaxID=1561998 RepID=A0A1I7T582_9PELO
MDNCNNKVEVASFKNCHWMTIENLMTVDALRIQIDNGKMYNNNEVNRFLRHWINGGSPRLKQIKMELAADWDEELFLNGLNVREGTQLERVYTGVYGQSITFWRSQPIVRRDGTKASFGVIDSNKFHLVVWPDSTGRTYESFD